MSRQKAHLSKEDRERLNRLYEEIVSRLHESSMIVARNLGKSKVRTGAATVLFGTQVESLSVNGGARNEARKIITIHIPEGQQTHAGTLYVYEDTGEAIGFEDEDTGECYEI